MRQRNKEIPPWGIGKFFDLRTLIVVNFISFFCRQFVFLFQPSCPVIIARNERWGDKYLNPNYPQFRVLRHVEGLDYQDELYLSQYVCLIETHPMPFFYPPLNYTPLKPYKVKICLFWNLKFQTRWLFRIRGFSCPLQALYFSWNKIISFPYNSFSLTPINSKCVLLLPLPPSLSHPSFFNFMRSSTLR